MISAPSQQIRFARSHDGARLGWATSGSGPPLIKAATWLSHLEFDWESPVWSHLLRGMSRHRTFVRYDERGCGLSDWAVPELNFESWVRDLETVADAAQAQTFAQFFTTQFIPGGTPAQHQWFNELERISTSPSNAVRFMREFARIDVTALLPKILCPTLVLHSQHDVRVPFEEGRLLAMSIAGARFVPIDSPNHLLLESEPGWKRWLDEVGAFLSQNEAPAEGTFVGLSRRQREVLELLAQGRDNTQIAAVLGVAEKTVRNHVTAIFDRLDVTSRAQAIVLARESGFGQIRR